MYSRRTTAHDFVIFLYQDESERVRNLQYKYKQGRKTSNILILLWKIRYHNGPGALGAFRGCSNEEELGDAIWILGKLILSFFNDAGPSGRRMRGMEGSLRNARADLGESEFKFGDTAVLGDPGPKGSSLARIYPRDDCLDRLPTLGLLGSVAVSTTIPRDAFERVVDWIYLVGEGSFGEAGSGSPAVKPKSTGSAKTATNITVSQTSYE